MLDIYYLRLLILKIIEIINNLKYINLKYKYIYIFKLNKS